MASKVTREVVEGFLNCPVKGHLSLLGNAGAKPDYAMLAATLRRNVGLEATNRILTSGSRDRVELGITVTSDTLKRGAAFILDGVVENDWLSLRLDCLQRVAGRSNLGAFHYLPVVFHESRGLTVAQKRLLAIFSVVLAELQGKTPEMGIVWHGKECRASKVVLKAHLRPAVNLLESVHQMQAGGSAPPLILNAHCPECEFLQRCRSQATKDDNLSLVRGIGAKEIKNYARKGIFTVSQLSHTFRPRRRGNRVEPGTHKRQHSLQAMAIRDATVYVLGTPKLRASRVRIFLDIESTFEHRFIYLIGMIVVTDGAEQRFSFWADSEAQERSIFEQFLAVLSQHEDFLLYSYGSYETAFLRRMRKQSALECQVDRALQVSVNTLSIVYPHIYFPTHGNGLKEVATSLGYSWSERDASGLQSICWRAKWEASRHDELKQKLVQYNLDDCAALKLVTDCVYSLFADPDPALPPAPQSAGQWRVARVQETDAHSRIRKWGAVHFVQPEYAYINGCAYFSYQRQKVYVKTNKTCRRSRPASTSSRCRRLKVTRHVEVRASECESCKSTKIVTVFGRMARKRGPRRKRVFDFVASTGGVKLSVIECHTELYQCGTCGVVFVPRNYERLCRYFHGVKSWAMYQHVAHGLSFGTVNEMIDVLFGLPIGRAELQRFKVEMAAYYEPTRQRLWERLLAGQLLHVDETQIRLKGGKTAYVWAFTNLEEVVYMYRPNREGEFLRELLKDFHGVLVSDFYTAYDSLECPQQKCLVHLIRDMNDDLLGNPFDNDLMAITKPFGSLLRAIVAEISDHGLKKWHLRRFKRDVATFFELVTSLSLRSDVAQALRDRLLKYQTKLFTFLDYDGVPWNNNNAENAIKRFAYYRRNASGLMKDSGVINFLTLLSLCQTCKYKGVNFWRFLSSREESIDAYAGKKRHRRSSQVDVYPDGFTTSWDKMCQSVARRVSADADKLVQLNESERTLTTESMGTNAAGVACTHASYQKHGKTRKGEQRYRCRACGKSWIEEPPT